MGPSSGSVRRRREGGGWGRGRPRPGGRGGGRGPRAPMWAGSGPELVARPGVSVITKRQQWGAFYGTELDLQLRRRGIDTILLAGISTNVGVESTARDSYERGYQQVFVEDAMAARNPAGIGRARGRARR